LAARFFASLSNGGNDLTFSACVKRFLTIDLDRPYEDDKTAAPATKKIK
jgi:hypothetical protein